MKKPKTTSVKSAYGPVIVYNDYCQQDALLGFPLVHGERLSVKWPDGTKTTCKVIVEEERSTQFDHTSPYSFVTRKAYVMVRVNGAKGQFRLCDADVLCKRVRNKR